MSKITPKGTSTPSVEIFQSSVGNSEFEPPSEQFPQGIVRCSNEEWTVEAINREGDGSIEQTIFRGPNTHERASRYIAVQYPDS